MHGVLWGIVVSFADPLHLSVCGLDIAVCCRDDETRSLLRATHSGMAVSKGTSNPDVVYRVGRDLVSGGFVVSSDEGDLAASDIAEFLYTFDKALTVALQRRRRDLFFVHGAVVEYEGKAIIIAAPSGTGKSTTAFALIQEGFGYVSDELAPIDPHSAVVYAYPHAVGLKTPPPAPYGLPESALYTDVGIQLPVESLPSYAVARPLQIRTLFFLTRESSPQPPRIRSLEVAATAAHLMANALNALAHPGGGLDSAIRIATQVAGYELRASDLKATCKAVKVFLGRKA
jgi:hypothetical protein